MSEWKEVTRGDVWQFSEDNDEIVGIVKTIREGDYNNKVYDIQTEHALLTIFGTTILDSKMENVKPNDKVKIQYLGEIKTKTGRFAKDFKVFIWKEE